MLSLTVHVGKTFASEQHIRKFKKVLFKTKASDKRLGKNHVKYTYKKCNKLFKHPQDCKVQLCKILQNTGRRSRY